MTVFEHHFGSIEQVLIAQGRVPASAGHTLHRGTPREVFIREFLDRHLSARVGVGSGEIIDRHSRFQDPRNQHDIVLYRKELPRLDLSGGVHAFLIESVVSTIEVKSNLTKDDVIAATAAAYRIKNLNRELFNPLRSGIEPISPLSFIVAYDGPASIETIHKWVMQAAAEVGFEYPPVPVDFDQRVRLWNVGLDGIFVLGKGFAAFDNSPISLVPDELRSKMGVSWIRCPHEQRSMLYLFTVLSQALNHFSAALFNPSGYVAEVQFGRVAIGKDFSS